MARGKKHTAEQILSLLLQVEMAVAIHVQPEQLVLGANHLVCVVDLLPCRS
jgi:hypothetical protein